MKTTEAGGPRGYAAEKVVKGRKRHILTDTTGLLVGAIVHPADVQDRDGAPRLLKTLRSAFPWLRHVFADSAYAANKLKRALAKLGEWTTEIVNGQMPPRALFSCRGVGWWSVRWRGSTAIAGLPRISRQRSTVPPPGSTSPASS